MAQADQPLLSLRGVSVVIGATRVLDAVDLTVDAGEIVTLIGPNGAGKTTLLRVALGLIDPERGHIVRKPGLRIGYMPQRLAVEPALPLTVRRFLALAAPGDASRAATLLERVGAQRTLGTPIQAISGGEMQRVLLARALLRDPHLLVLDEPTQGVDLAGQEELFALITGIRDERGCGVLMVSHDLHLVMGSTDRVVCLNRAICCTGTPHAVSDDPAYRRLFPAGAPGLAMYTHRHDADAPCRERESRNG
ncbi:MAG TPA: ATP-binding cassette domain-containing protein [Candidatus Methanoperedens sp.]|nr:ATP-binding cassette domain-containing protein [Candidatus Methanoperedens sp.]